MHPTIINALVSRISTLNDLPNENAATAAMAEALHSTGIRSFWTAKTIWPRLKGCSKNTSWRGSKSYDLSWASGFKASTPDHVMQVKLGTKSQEDQEVLLFLGDLAFAALDYAATGPHKVCVAVIPRFRTTTYWSRLSPKMGAAMTLHLRPNTAVSGIARGSQWIDPVTARIEPRTFSQYNKIFGAGTNAKFIGLFRRGGDVVITSTVSLHKAGRYLLLVYEINSNPIFTGTGTISEWWP